jgi:MFS transporter, DHA2 family, multidrug resistance protein
MTSHEHQHGTGRKILERDESYRRRWWTLAVLSVSRLIIIIDDTIINIAVPTLQRELGASASALQWVVDAYIVVFAGLLLSMGRSATASAGSGSCSSGCWCSPGRACWGPTQGRRRS